MIRPILTDDAPELRVTAASVLHVTDEIRATLDDMMETMLDQQGRAIGLAGPQIGIQLRLVVVVDKDDGYEKDGRTVLRAYKMVNPRFADKSGIRISAYESCLSLPGCRVRVKRAASGRVEWRDENGKPWRKRFKGLIARTLQHEIDHLDGVLIRDHGRMEMVT